MEIIIKMDFEEMGREGKRALSGLNWLRTGTSGGLL
jgi:hypothetical protein